MREKVTPLRVFWPLSPVQEKAASSSLTRGEGGAPGGEVMSVEGWEVMSGKGGAPGGDVILGEGGAAGGIVMSGEVRELVS